MYISSFTDYAFRALMYLAINNEKLCTVEELSKALNISENHIKKIVHKLAKGGFINSIKGRAGGIKLAKNPDDINLADVIIFCDELNEVIKCFKGEKSCSYLEKGCKLKKIIDDSVNVFKNEFRKYTLKDIL